MVLGVVVLDTSLRVKSWNWPAARMWGLRPEDAVNRDFLGLPIGDVTGLAHDALRRTLEHRRPEIIPEVAYTMPDGRQQKTAFRLAPLIGPGGELLGILCMATPDAKLLETGERGSR
jgi:PAS domain-containing protein